MEHAKRFLFCLGVVVLQVAASIPIARANDAESTVLNLMEKEKIKHEAEEASPPALCQPGNLRKVAFKS